MRQEERQKSEMTGLLVAGVVCCSVAVGLGVLMSEGSFLVALVAAIATMGTIGALASTEVALYAVITVGCFDGIIKGLYPGMAAMVLKDVFLGVAVLHWIWDGVNGSPRNSLSLRVALPAFLFIAYGVAQMFNSETVSWVLAIAGLRSWAIWIPAFFITYDTFRTRRQFERLVMFIAVVSAGTAVYGTIQHQIGFTHLYNISPTFGFYTAFAHGSAVRAPGTYVHPGTAGSALSFAATVCAGLALAAPAFSARQVLLLAAAPVCLVGMAATGSRAPLVGAAIGIAVFLLLTRQPQLLLGLAIFAIFGVWQSEKYVGRMVSSRYSSSRLNLRIIWGRAIGPFHRAFEMLSRYPLGTGVASGVGAGRAVQFVDSPTYVKSETAVFIENEIGRAMKELGLPGVLIFVWLIISALRTALAGWRASSGRDSWLASGLVAGAVNLSVQLMVGSALYLAPGGVYFWVACALAAKIPDYEAMDGAALAERSAEDEEAWQALKSKTQGGAQAPQQARDANRESDTVPGKAPTNQEAGED